MPINGEEVEQVEQQQEDGSSEEEEEEEAPQPQKKQVQWVMTSNIDGHEIDENAPTSPTVVTTVQKTTTTTVGGEADAVAAHQAAIEAAKQRQQEAMEKARAEAQRLQEEARARAEAARQQQQQQAAEQARQQAEQQLKAQQEAAKRQAEERAAQLKTQQQKPVVFTQTAAPAPVQQQQQKNPQAPPHQQQPKPAAAAPAANNPAAAAPAPAQSAQPRAPPPIVREAQPPEAPSKPVLRHSKYEPKPVEAVVNVANKQAAVVPDSVETYAKVQWREVPEEEEQPQLVSAPRNPIIDDANWQVQRRVQPEYQPVQPAKMKVSEFSDEGEIKKTIVPDAAAYSKIKWEFPEEEEKERQSVPKVPAQEWVPEHDVEHHVQKTVYNPGRIGPNPNTGRVWPPAGYGDEEQIEMGQAMRTRTQGDQDWIKANGQPEVSEDDAVGNAPWKRHARGGDVKSRQWPPEEQKPEYEIGAGGRIQAQWPPPDAEEIAQGKVEILQTHLPASRQQYQWPPADNAEEKVPGAGGRLQQTQWPPAEFEEYEQRKVESIQKRLPSSRQQYQWPPPENPFEKEAIQGGRLNAQWPPTESEEREQKYVEIVQTHLPVAKQGDVAWPPPGLFPEYDQQAPIESV